MDYVSRAIVAQQFIGTNAQEVLDACALSSQFTGNEWTIMGSSTSTRLVLREFNPVSGVRYNWTILAPQVVVIALDSSIIARMTPEAYAARWRTINSIVTEALNSAGLAAQLAALRYGGFGMASISALLLGGEVSIPVTIAPVQPDTKYVATAHAMSATAVLASVQVVSVTNTSTSVVTVRIRNTGIATLNGLLLVHVTAPLTAPTAAK